MRFLVGWWAVTAAVLLTFLVLDLHAAQFAWTLLALPLGAIVSWIVVRAATPGSVLALSVWWLALARRADNGCTGVSDVYTFTMLTLLPVTFLFGPAAIIVSLRARRRSARGSSRSVGHP